MYKRQLLPEGITEIAVDSIFMTPQLGVLSTVHEAAATEVFERDCLVPLGACVAPVGAGRAGQACVTVEVHGGGAPREVRVPFGGLQRVAPSRSERVRLLVRPERGFDVGAGRGRPVEREVRGGVVGVVVDARGRRPFAMPLHLDERIRALREWNRVMDAFPRDI